MMKFFVSCAVSFRSAENEFFLDFVKDLSKIRFIYKPKERHTFASTVLEAVHEEIIEAKRQILSNTDSVLLMDGWKNKSVNRKYLVYTLRNAHCPQLFLSFTNFSTQKETAVNLSNHAENAIAVAKEVYNTNVIGVSTDNDSKIVAGARETTNTEGESLLPSTCTSHSGDLLIEKIVDQNFLRIVREIVNIFKDPSLESELVETFGGTKLKNYPDTRFCYARDCYESVLKNLRHLRSVVELDHIDIGDKKEAIQHLYNPDFENLLKREIKLITQVCKMVNKCQDPKMSLAESTQLWLQLKFDEDAVNSEGIKLNQLLENRKKKALGVVAFAANLLHYKYRGTLMNSDQRENAIRFIKSKVNQKGAKELDTYLNFSERFKWFSDRCKSCESFWTWCELDLTPNLAVFAHKLMLLPASTALIESLFSNWSYVHNIYRARLSDEKSGMLIDIYHSLKFIDFSTMSPKIPKKRPPKKHLIIEP